jgi:hypothetical protein
MAAKATSRPEGRPRLTGNSGEQARDRTQSRVILSANLTIVNEAAKRSRQTRFTALPHHVDVAGLERAYRRLRRNLIPVWIGGWSADNTAGGRATKNSV